MKPIFLSLTFLMVFTLQSQNLVPNYSFEENTNRCPISQGNLYTTHWYSPNGQTSDFFTTCGLYKWYSTPDNSDNFGFQEAATGNNYVGIRPLYEPGRNSVVKEYISVELKDSLIKCKSYNISFKVSLADNYDLAVWQLGMLFTKEKVSEFKSTIQLQPQVVNKKENFIVDQNNWVTIQGQYLAQGGEKHITIGNFNENKNTDFISAGSSGQYNSYYYIDDVVVEPINNIDNIFPLDNHIICQDSNFTYLFPGLPDSIFIESNDTIISITTKQMELNRNGDYKISVFERDCITKYSLGISTINCKPEISLPNIITPNNDGINDVFQPIINNNTYNNQLIIFNRWGKEIFKSNIVEWNPNNIIKNGTYFYQMSYEDNKSNFLAVKGWFIIQR